MSARPSAWKFFTVCKKLVLLNTLNLFSRIKDRFQSSEEMKSSYDGSTIGH